jgi:pimeloyl-ACP methyl ester carboxylesterase
MISQILGTGWNAVKRTSQVGLAATQAIGSELSGYLETSDSATLSVAGAWLAPDASAAKIRGGANRNPAAKLPLGVRLAQRVFKNIDLDDSGKKAVLEALEGVEAGQKPFKSVSDFQNRVKKQLGSEVAVDQLAEKHPNFFPSLLANARQHPPLALKGKVAFDFSEVAARRIEFFSKDGRVVAEVSSSVGELLGKNARTDRLAQDYASDDIPLKLTVPLGDGTASSYQKLPAAAKRQMLKQATQAAPTVTTLVHGFQSNKEIWDSTGAQWADPDSLTIAFDGFGGDGSARTDASAPYTPKQYGFQVLEALDALGLLGAKDLKVVGHSMGGAATGEMAVALDKAGYSGKADFVMLAPACSPDHMPLFGTHKTAMDVVNAVLLGGIYVPMGAWQVTAPLVRWTDENFPVLSKMMVDHGLGLKDSPPDVREHNAGYHRTADPAKNKIRRERSLEAMMGMATQKGIDPKELRQAARKFGVYVASFGHDRLVSPEALHRLKGKGVGFIELPSASHNGCFAPEIAQRLSQASSDFFAAR